MDEVGVNAFATSLGVAIEFEPKLLPVVEQLYRQCTETISRARLVAARGGDPLTSLPPQSSKTRSSSTTTALPPPTHHPTQQTNQFKRSPSASSQHYETSNNYSPESQPATKPQEPPAVSKSTNQQQQEQPEQQRPLPAVVVVESKRISPSPSREHHQEHHHQSTTSSSNPKPSTSAATQRNLNPEFLSMRNNSPDHQVPAYFGYNDDVLGYARFIGIDPDVEPYLLPIAKEGLYSSLPEGWNKQKSRKDGAVYYYNTRTGDTTWEHPMDEEYRRRVADARRAEKKNSSRRNNNYNNNENVSSASSMPTRRSASAASNRFAMSESLMMPNNNNSNNNHNLNNNSLLESDCLPSVIPQPPPDALASSITSQSNIFPVTSSSATGTRSRGLISPSRRNNNVNNQSSPSSSSKKKDVDERVEAFAAHIGIDPQTEPYLLPIAREALLAPLPPNWKSYHNSEGVVYYCNSETEDVSWDHPLLERFRAQVEKGRRNYNSRNNNNSINRRSVSPLRSPSSRRTAGERSNVQNQAGFVGGQQQHHLSPSASSSSLNYSKEVLQYAKFLGVDPTRGDGPELMEIVVEGFNAPLPAGWESYRSDDDDGQQVYYANAALGKSMWDHPLDSVYRDRIADARAKIMMRRR